VGHCLLTTVEEAVSPPRPASIKEGRTKVKESGEEVGSLLYALLSRGRMLGDAETDRIFIINATGGI
jgi:hypothetical protein